MVHYHNWKISHYYIKKISLRVRDETGGLTGVSGGDDITCPTRDISMS